MGFLGKVQISRTQHVNRGVGGLRRSENNRDRGGTAVKRASASRREPDGSLSGNELTVTHLHDEGK